MLEQQPSEQKDVIEEIVHEMHIILPIAAACMMFLMIGIAITMA
jgi:hypothetical protein